MVWPIKDTRMTRNELMQEAAADLRAEYQKLALRPVSAPVFKFGHWHDRPALVAHVAVVQLPAFPDEEVTP